MKIELWTDGSGTSEGPGGWAYVLRAIHEGTGEVLKQVECSGAMVEATNNRAELTAILEGLYAVHAPSRIVVFTDSEFVVNTIEKGWLKGWMKRGWMTGSGKGPTLEEFPFMCPSCARPLVTPDVCARHEPEVQAVARDSRKHVANRDLWEAYLRVADFHAVSLTHVRGHAGVELNEVCDKLAGEARRSLLSGV